MKNIKNWFLYTLLGVLLGSLLGYLFVWLWFIFTLFILGYGDSGPSWINMVNNILFWSGLIFGIMGSQLLFFIDWKKYKRE